MKIVQLPRNGGKTTDMLVWLLDGHSKGVDRALIVTTDQERASISRRLQKLYFEHGQPSYINNAANRVYSVSAVKKLSPNHLRNCEIGIDDVDRVLTWLLGINRFPSIISVTDYDSGTGEPETIRVV